MENSRAGKVTPPLGAELRDERVECSSWMGERFDTLVVDFLEGSLIRRSMA